MAAIVFTDQHSEIGRPVINIFGKYVEIMACKTKVKLLYSLVEFISILQQRIFLVCHTENKQPFFSY